MFVLRLSHWGRAVHVAYANGASRALAVSCRSVGVAVEGDDLRVVDKSVNGRVVVVAEGLSPPIWNW